MAEVSELRERVQALFMRRPDVNAADLAAHTTLGSSTVKKFVGGLQAETPRVKSELARVLRLEELGEILTPARALTVRERDTVVRRVAKKHEFYVTETVRCVAQVLNYCHERSAIGVITADYGTGKTEAVAAWRRGDGRRVECVALEFDDYTACNKVTFIQSLAESLGIEYTRRGMQDGAWVFRAVCDWLREHPHLLIFDQAELCRPRVCQVIRQIWDRTRDAGVGVALLAAPVLLVRLKSMPDLGALQSRVGICAPLAGVTRGEMAAIVKQERIADLEEEAFDVWWRATGGSMRRLMMAIDLIQSKHAGKAVTAKTIAGVAQSLWGMRVA